VEETYLLPKIHIFKLAGPSQELRLGKTGFSVLDDSIVEYF
jgi:hypothetical protein